MLCAGFDFVHLIIAKHPPPVHHACTTGSPQKLMDESIFEMECLYLEMMNGMGFINDFEVEYNLG